MDIVRTGQTRGYLIGSTDQDGSFDIDFSDPHPSPFFEPANIKSGDRVTISCMQDTGDWVQLKFVAP